MVQGEVIGDPEAELHRRAWAGLERGSVYLRDQQQADGGWGSEEGEASDPWASAEAAFALARARGHLSPEVRVPVDQGLTIAGQFLVDSQEDDGAYSSAQYRGHTNVTTAAWAVLALEELDASRHRHAIDSSSEWISEAQLEVGGWMDELRESERRHHEPRLYPTAYALKALSRQTKQAERSSSINLGLEYLFKAREKGRAWGTIEHSESEPTYTCYCLDGIFDANEYYGTLVSKKSLRQALVWLKGRRTHDGLWSDWQGNKKSAESSAYSVLILLRAGVSPESRLIRGTLTRLLDEQDDSGGWRLNLQGAGRPAVWVTHNVLLALTEYLSKWRVAIPARI